MKPTVTTPTEGAEATPKFENHPSSHDFSLDERTWQYLFFPGVGAATLARGGGVQYAAYQFKMGFIAAILYFGIFLALSKQFKTPMLLKIAAAVWAIGCIGFFFAFYRRK